MSPRVRLIGAAVLFCGWLAWLGYAAVAKNRGPVVSRAQMTAVVGEKEKGIAVVARVDAGPDGKAEPRAVVQEVLTADGPKDGTELEVANLPASAGFAGSGDYLLLLVHDRQTGGWVVAGRQRSPGYDPGADVRPTDPVIYPATDDVKAQATKLLR